MENKTIEELLSSFQFHSETSARVFLLQDFVGGERQGLKAVEYRQEILKRFKKLEEYKFMYEGLEK